MGKRSSIASAASFIVMNQVAMSKHFYKLIKDCGGFTKLDLSGRPKYTLIDLNHEIEKDEEESKLEANNSAPRVDVLISASSQTDSPNDLLIIPTDVNTGDSSVVSNHDDDDIFDLSPSQFGDHGPELM
jgi:hypothetical protein